MRIFVTYENDRITIDIPDGGTVQFVKEDIRDKFCIGPDEGPSGAEQQEKKILTLSYAGADLDPRWIFADIGILAGSTIKAVLKDEVKPSVFIYSVFNEEIVPIYEKIDFQTMTVSEFKGIVSRKTGLPVAIFRLINTQTPHGLEMYDCNKLDDYNIALGSTVRMETWDGWNDFLNLCIMGYASHVLAKLYTDEVIAKYQLKVALYIAAHFGHVDLAVSILRTGTRADEPIGEHPLRMWCKGAVEHIDSKKCPVHEASETGQLGILRSFVHNNICNALAKDGNGLTPLNIALRRRQKPCASFLLTKQWSKVSYAKKNSLPLSIFVKMKRWSERSKDKVLMIHGQWKSSIKNPRRLPANGALLGHGVMLNGFNTSKMTSKPSMLARQDEEEERRRKHVDWRLDVDQRNLDPETYFKSLGAITSLKLPKLSRWTKAMVRATQDKREKEKAKERDRESIAGETDSFVTRDARDQMTEVPSDDDVFQSPDVARRRVPRPRSNSTSRLETTRLRLPPIKETKKVSMSHHNLTSGEKPAGSEMNASKSGAYLKTGSTHPSQAWSSKGSVSTQSNGEGATGEGKPEKEKEKEPEGKTPRKKRKSSEVIMAKSRARDGSIPLPMRSIDNNPRPFAKGDVNKATLDLFERHRGIKSRDYAIKCMSVANNFKDRPWLQQVHQAMHIAAKGVKKIVDQEPYLFTPDVEGSKGGKSKKRIGKGASSDSLLSIATM